MDQRRLLIVEDDVFVAVLLQESLSARGFDVAIEHTAVSAKERLNNFDADVALIDVELGDGPSGIELMQVIVRAHPETAVIMMTQRAALAEGINLPTGVTFLLKSQITDPQALLTAIESAIRGQTIRHQPSPTDLSRLTSAQEDVLRMIALGYSNIRIAQERKITRSGAEQAVTSVLKALEIDASKGITPRVEAARRYIAAKGIPTTRA